MPKLLFWWPVWVGVSLTLSILLTQSQSCCSIPGRHHHHHLCRRVSSFYSQSLINNVQAKIQQLVLCFELDGVLHFPRIHDDDGGRLLFFSLFIFSHSLSLSLSISLSLVPLPLPPLCHIWWLVHDQEICCQRGKMEILGQAKIQIILISSREFTSGTCFSLSTLSSHLFHHLTSKKMNCPTLFPSPRWWLLVSARISFLVICKLNSTDSISVTPRF